MDLCAYAEHELNLSTPEPDGVPKREHLRMAQERLGRPIAELQSEPLAAELHYLWQWFVQLSNARSSQTAISFQEIQAWAQLKRVELDPFEVEAIKALDQVFLNIFRKKAIQ